MNIDPLIDENLTITLDYFNLSKLLYEELLNYMKLYKTSTSQYCQKISFLQLELENKIINYKIEINQKINNSHIFQFIKLFPDIIKKQILVYLPVLDNIEKFIKNFNALINQKVLLIKNQQDKYNESKKMFKQKFQEIENYKIQYFNNLSQTEDIINEYFTQKKKIEEFNNYTKNNKRTNINLEQYKKLEEKSKNLTKETKNIGNNYISSIEISKKYHNNMKNLLNQTINIIKSSLYDLSNQYKNNLFEILGTFKPCFQTPLNIVLSNLETISKSKEEEIIDEIFNNICNKNVSTINILPNKYKLKVINSLNNNNDNIFSMSFFENEDIEKINDNNEVTEINLELIKYMYNNFSLLFNHKIDIKLEEEKLYTSKLSEKLFLNIINFNNNIINKNNKNKQIPEEQIFTEEDSNELIKLLDKKMNRLIFLKKLNNFRTESKLSLPLNHYITIGKSLNILLSKFEEDKDYNITKSCIILSQTYYYMHSNIKIYLKIYVEENPIFKETTFWDKMITFLIEKEIESKKKDNLIPKNGFTNVAFGILYTFIDTMFEFGVNENEINKIIEPIIEKYIKDDKFMKDINNLIQSKIENKNNKSSEGKISHDDLINIIENYNKNINIKNNPNINKEEKSLINKGNNQNREKGKNKTNNIWEIDDDE